MKANVRSLVTLILSATLFAGAASAQHPADGSYAYEENGNNIGRVTVLHLNKNFFSVSIQIRMPDGSYGDPSVQLMERNITGQLIGLPPGFTLIDVDSCANQASKHGTVRNGSETGSIQRGSC
ncbi:MAG: hypothetical protein JNN13_13195 [Planctomycetes bacterium]|nr:hypothetical protein [Planctomycetota bacterium]